MSRATRKNSTVRQVDSDGRYKRKVYEFNVVDYGADPTGTNDSTAAFNAALAARSTKDSLPFGEIYFPPGNYRINGPTTPWNPNQTSVRGAGMYVTTVYYYGSGDCFRVQNPSYPPPGYSWSSVQYGGFVDGLAIDGTNAGAGACGLHLGDTDNSRIGPDLSIAHFNGAGSIGLHLDNNIWFTEKLNGRCQLVDCTTGVVFDVTSNTGTSPNSSTFSFGYCSLEFILQLSDYQNAVVFQNGARLYNGSLKIRGNMNTTPAANSAAVLTLQGSVAAGHPQAGTTSGVVTCNLDIQVESGPGASQSGAFKPRTILALNNGVISGCYGILSFSGSGFQTASGLGLGSSFTYIGMITGDNVLNPAQSGVLNPTTPVVYASGFINGTGSLYIGRGDFFSTTLTANGTVTFVNGQLGPQRKTIVVKQGSAGGFTLSWPKNASPTTTAPNIIWAGGTAPTMTATANAVDVYYLDTFDGLTWYGRAAQNMS